MREQSLFIEALEKEDPSDRATFLDQACAGDGALRERIDRLLARHAADPSEADSFLVPPLSVLLPTVDDPIRERPGTVIDAYKLMEKLGEGGMGLVFVAEQLRPVRRKVALKVIKPGMDTAQVIARFEAERQALALMDHPNIARVLDAGTTDAGRPYFVMELVKGVPITQYCDEHHLPVRDRLGLFLDVCGAVQHAHMKGVIHRDIKPSNVMVTSHDGTPVVKIIDFGVAKAIGQQLTDKTIYTQHSQLIGTPLYMSPEQAGQSGLDVDTRTDIYALGVLLYELLTGSTPFDRDRLQTVGFDEMRRILREEDPPKPSTRVSTVGPAPDAVSTNRRCEPRMLSRLLRGELDWIVMKALEKDRTRRYDTANSFAADVRCYLADEPVRACPPSAGYRLRKFARRRMGLLVTTGLVLLSLVAGMVGTTLALLEARAQAGQARWEAKQARQSDAASKAVLEFFETRVLSAARPKGQGRGLGRDATIRAAVDAAEAGIGEGFADQPLAEASLRRALGLTYWYAGDYAKAIPQHEQALALRQAHLDADHPDTLNSMTNLGQAYQSAGRLTDALRVHQATLALRVARLGPDHTETLWTMNRLAGTLGLLGRAAEAVPIYEDALARAKAALGPDHADTLIYMDKLAEAYRNVGRVPEAVRQFEDAYKLYQGTFAPDHPDRLATMSNVALIYTEVGRFAEAIPLQRQALDLKKATLGADHPETLITQHNLGVAYRDSGKPAEGLPLLEEALKLHTARLGPEHHITLFFAFNLAWQYRDVGRLEEALAVFREASRLMATKLGVDHPRRLLVLNHTGTCLLKMKRYDEADVLVREALALRTRKAPGEWWVGQTRSQLGQAAAGLKRYAEAETLLLAAHKELAKRKAEIPYRYQPYVGEAARALADLYEAWGKKDQAAAWRKPAMPD